MSSRRTAFFALLPLLVLGGACNTSEPILNGKPDLELCRTDPGFQKLHFDGWNEGGTGMDVRFLPRGTKPCPARRFPFVDVKATAPVRWIQVVEVNVPIPMGEDKKPSPSWQLGEGSEPWIFADMVPERRDSGEPFVNAGTDGRFWDNPAWPDPPKQDQKDGARKWRSRSYAVIAEGKKVRAVAGFTWGWTWTVGAENPEPFPPEKLAPDAWKADAPRLAKAFEGWSFE
ncbi:MAG: hypothetical protein R3B70_26900 [Polyangiaceae bacterium]